MIIMVLTSGLLVSCVQKTGPAASSTPAPTQTPPEEPESEQFQFRPRLSPTHNIPPKDLIDDSQYWNTDWEPGELYQTICSINESYHEEHTYIEGVLDCSDMVLDIWDMLSNQGIISVIIIGNPDLDKETFAECNHVWLLVQHKEDAGFRVFFIETTNGEIYTLDPDKKELMQYLEGYYYSSPSDARADFWGRW